MPPVRPRPAATATLLAVAAVTAACETPNYATHSGEPVVRPAFRAFEAPEGTTKKESGHLAFGMPRMRDGSRPVRIQRYREFVAAYDTHDRIPIWAAFTLTRAWCTPMFLSPYRDQDLGRAAGTRYPDSDYYAARLLDPLDASGRGLDGPGEQFDPETDGQDNTIPQLGIVNDAGWRQLAGLCRDWARRFGRIWIFSGPAFVPDHRGLVSYWRTGPSYRTAVPTHFFKIVVRRNSDQSDESTDSSPHLLTQAFLIPHAELDRPLASYLVSIDTIEKVTGLDFLAALSHATQATLEAAPAAAVWAR